MKVLLVGSGGREHALAQAIERSDRLTSLAVAPGNAGTEANNVALDVADHGAVVQYCNDNGIDLVVVGPEAPLVAGLSDVLSEADIACFGPSKAAAQLEGSKSFTRSFAESCGIPQPLSKVFTSSREAIAWADEQPFDVVVKADGLAAGKGVIIPESRDHVVAAITSMIDDRDFGESGATVVLEERMVGEELSLFGVSDGTSVVALATAQDHKRVGEGDTGLNTGGMGAFSPVPGIDADRQAELAAMFLEPAIAGMTAATTGTLDQYELEMRDGYAAAVVVCADGYPASPTTGVPVPDLGRTDSVSTFYAGAARDEAGQLVSNGGRVLAITGMGEDLDTALANSYRLVDQVTGQGLFARGDIGWRHSAVRSSKV